MKKINKSVIYVLLVILFMGCGKKINKSLPKIEIKAETTAILELEISPVEKIKVKKIEIKPLVWQKYIVGTWEEDRACLYNIAEEILYNSLLWPQLYEYNKDKIVNPDLIYPEQVLRYLRK